MISKQGDCGHSYSAFRTASRRNKQQGVGRDTPGSERDEDNELLLYFGFNTTCRKGKKGSKFPLKKAVRPCESVHPGRPRNVATHEEISESVVMFR